MPLAPSTRIGPYEIKSALGTGGMGEVYRARDSRLNRDVALKVLRSDATVTPDLKARFEREARAVAALNHPNIVAVYDFGIDAGSQYIVSELIDGESLRTVIAAKPVPTRKLIDIAVQIADGLAAAHAAGIVHRDLKPENLLLTKDGRVKTLDFGLARQTTKSVPANDSDETYAPDPTRNLTSAGSILGTAAYMSPEQAVGKEIGYASDQFSFGLILHEMATGKQAFARGSSVETMAAIVRDEPPPIEQKIPPPLKWIIDRCLHKEPQQRYESTRDLYQELRNLREHFSEAYTSESYAAVTGTRARPKWWKIPAIGAACALTAALLVYVLKPSGQDIGRYSYTPFAVQAAGAIWSPDGKAVAYSGNVDGTWQVFLRYLNSPVPVQLTHEKYAMQILGWSSDRNHLIVDEDTDFQGSPPKKLYSVPTVGGELDFIMNADCKGCGLARDGKAFATLARGKNPGDMVNVFISDPLGSPLKPYYSSSLFAMKDFVGVSDCTFSPDGTKLLVSGAGEHSEKETWLLPYPADGRAPRRILHEPSTLNPESSYSSWMPDSRHVVIGLSAHLWLADTQSSDLTPLTASHTNEYAPSVAPDGRSLLYESSRSSADVILVSLADGSATTLISSGKGDINAVWSARTEKLAWESARSGKSAIWVRGSDHAERPAVTTADFPGSQMSSVEEPALSPDGERLLFEATNQARIDRLWISSLAGGSPVRLTNVEPSSEYAAAWSPDGSRCVYLQYTAGKRSLMEIRANGGATPVELKKDVGRYFPNWSPAGDWITYRDEKGWNLISPDGKTTRSLGKIESQYLAFSRDGKLLYGIRTDESGGDPKPAILFSLDPATHKTKEIKDIGKDLGLPTEFPILQFSLTPDGKSIACTAVKYGRDLWMLTGYRQPGLWNGIKYALQFGPPT